MYHFFVTPDQITEEQVVLFGQDVNHIRRVLRMKPAEEILVSDGEGTDYHCRIEDIQEEQILCRILEKTESGSEPKARFYLFQGLPKADKLEHVIQKAVELGVYEIIPVRTDRSVVKYDLKKQKTKQERWQKIAEGAAKQSHRGIVPEVKEVMAFKEALAYAGSASLDLLLFPYENYKDIKRTKEIIADIKPGMKVGIFVGPEGGFAPEEVEAALSAGAAQISLGNRILRTETAPLMLLSVLMFALE